MENKNNQIINQENNNKELNRINLLYKEWQNNQKDGELLVRLAFECWHILSESFRLELSAADAEKAKEILIEVKDKIMESKIKNSYVLSHVGYMITMFPDLFYEGEADELYKKHQIIGSKMLKGAVKISPEDKIAQLFMLGNNNKEKAYNTLKKELKPQIAIIYNGNDTFCTYFKEVLS